MDYDSIIAWLESKSSRTNVTGMARFGITSGKVYGVPMKELPPMAKRVGKDHSLAARPWTQGSHEARILAVFIDDPREVTGEQGEGWVLDLDNWALCDALCMHLLWKTPFGYEKAVEWSSRGQEFVKRAGFAFDGPLRLVGQEGFGRAHSRVPSPDRT